MMKESLVVGIMSGSSLDGLDVVLVNFKMNEHGDLDWRIVGSEIFDIPENLKQKLKKSECLSLKDFFELDVEYGKFIGEKVMSFLHPFSDLRVGGIGLHGHTVFHEPKDGYSIQLGNPNHIFASTNIPVIYDFRQLDIAFEGQGAPLVPCAEFQLFNEYDGFINLGGIINVSKIEAGNPVGKDIGAFNQVLNYFANKLGYAFDNNGEISKSGKVNEKVIKCLKEDPFYAKKGPKSLSNQFVKENVISTLEGLTLPPEDIMKSFLKYTSELVKEGFNGCENILVTGGGAKNKTFLNFLDNRFKVVDNDVTEFKEAIIFAWLAYQKQQGKVNVLKSVTGGKANLCSGTIVSNS